MWNTIRAMWVSVTGSNPIPRLLGLVVAVGELAKLGQAGLEQGAVPTDAHDWLMFWLGIGLAFAKQYNKSNAPVPSPTTLTVPKPGA